MIPSKTRVENNHYNSNWLVSWSSTNWQGKVGWGGEIPKDMLHFPCEDHPEESEAGRSVSTGHHDGAYHTGV